MQKYKLLGGIVDVWVEEYILPNDLAKIINTSSKEIIDYLAELGVFVHAEQRLDLDIMYWAVQGFGYKLEGL